MLKIGLTGGIACGKSTVLAMFAELGAQTLRADEVAHRLMAPGEHVFERIVKAFGQQILAADGTIARAKLAEAAFPARVKELNEIVHPAVLAFMDDWAREAAHRDPAGVAICEAALIIEAGAVERYDKLIVVTCTPEQKVSRFAQRTGMSIEAAREEVQRRMAAQMPEEEKVKLAAYVIDNSGSEGDAEKKVREVWRQLEIESQPQACSDTAEI